MVEKTKKDTLMIDTKEFIEMKINHLEEKMDIIFEKNQTALKQANTEMNRRLDGMNEFREQLNNQAKTFMTKPEYESKHEGLIERVETCVDSLNGKMDNKDRELSKRIDALAKLVYIGLGIFIVLEFLISAGVINIK